jgi:hypothetical protein
VFVGLTENSQVFQNLICPLDKTHSDWSATSRRTATVPIGTQKILFDHFWGSLKFRSRTKFFKGD